MLTTLTNRLFGSRNQRVLNRMQKAVEQINALEKPTKALSDEQLKAKTAEFMQRLQQGEKLDRLLPEAFAVVRETAFRTLGMRHFDVQLIGGMVLHEGNIAEMRTGEGKTLMATLPAYLNALTGRGVHIVTVNDYLANRDAEWMNPIYGFLGLAVGVVVPNMDREQKKAAYQADIVYGTNNEFGFDYLRDNMAFSLDQKVQRDLHFAIVDEVDSILIDEARTPLIISGAAEDGSEMYTNINRLMQSLTKQDSEEAGGGDFYLDEKSKQAFLTEQGHEHVEALLIKEGLLAPGSSLYDAANIALMHYLNASLRAHYLYQKDVDYIVQNDEVVIVDEHTGRTMPGRRWSEGLHQAVEAKEGVSIHSENQTLASITFQNYFRLYDKLAGMTGTADTEAYEFHEIYKLEVIVIPTNKPMRRDDQTDLVYLNQKDKFSAIISDIKACRDRQQPVLVGTASIEASELLSALLNKAHIPHQVLNAKFHAKEATIIAEAGRPGVVTIATNMAGRGTDIVLGGNLDAELKALPEEAADEQRAMLRSAWQQRHEAVIASGGLRIVGSERHESRRIDNQLRGRAGRQGDPGSSRFYLSLEDNLMRIFASDRVAAIMQKLGMQEGEAIEHRWVTRAIENAQRKVEGRNFDVRKQLLEYDNVANDQRSVIYSQRSQLMKSEDISERIREIRSDVTKALVARYLPPESLEEQWDLPGLEQQLAKDFALTLPITHWVEEDQGLDEAGIVQRVLAAVDEHYQAKDALSGGAPLRQFEKSVMLQVLDNQWREHLASMDYLRQGIHLRGYAHRDPKQEYKREAYALFTSMLDNIKYEVTSILAKVRIQAQADVDEAERLRQQQAESFSQHLQHAEMSMTQPNIALPTEEGEQPHVPYVRHQPKVGRNDPCPCGSGKKYKQCHGRVD